MSVSTKLKEKECILRFKHGSPKLKDVLRKKCKERLQKNRHDFIDKLRNLDGDFDIKNELTSIVKEDLKTVYRSGNNNLMIASILPEEDKPDEELEWIMSKYDTIFDNEEYLMDMFESINEVICPLCQKNPLLENIKEDKYIISCGHCNFSTVSSYDLLQIKENLMTCLDDHNKNCSIDPQFSLLSELGDCHIFMICCFCANLSMIV